MLRLAFNRGGRSLFDRIIRRKTLGPHTHVELVFSDGLSWSSSQWDGGTRFKRIVYDLAQWDLVPVRVSRAQERAIRTWCQHHAGLPYDWRGVLGLFLGRLNPGKNYLWWCSEGCCRACQEGGAAFRDLNPSMTSPELLWAAAVSREEGYAHRVRRRRAPC
jgi:uncharacterized protein YycO